MRYITLLLLIGASLGVFFMYVKPRYDAIETIKSDIAGYQTNLVTANKIKTSREDLIQKYNNIPASDLTNLKTLLPDSVDNIRLIIQIDSLATTNGLSTLRNVNYQSSDTVTTSATTVGGTPATATPASASATTTGVAGQSPVNARKPYGSLTVSFQTTGQYKNFLTFLSALEQNLRMVDVTNVDFSTTENVSTGSTSSSGTSLGQGIVGNITYKVTLTTYWLKQ